MPTPEQQRTSLWVPGSTAPSSGQALHLPVRSLQGLGSRMRVLPVIHWTVLDPKILDSKGCLSLCPRDVLVKARGFAGSRAWTYRLECLGDNVYVRPRHYEIEPKQGRKAESDCKPGTKVLVLLHLHDLALYSPESRTLTSNLAFQLYMQR